ncbi:MAG: hypothetical protein IJ035_09525 [Oscillospiraceae bacterium]|nr:hypothetical protein [Oscillospiraceae bacterium]
MGDYVLQAGEKLNGGYSVQIGDVTVNVIGKYSPRWEKVYDNENSFQNYLGNQVRPLIGYRFLIDIETGRLNKEKLEALITELNKESVNVVCPDFEGECYCDNAPANLEQANFLGVRYRLPLTLIAKDIIPAGDGL